MKNTLFLSPFFYPEPISTGRYNSFLVRELVEQGDTVTIVTSYPLYPDWAPSTDVTDMPGVITLRGGSGIRYPKPILFRRLVLEVWFTMHTIRMTWKLRRRIDRVIAVFPPNLYFSMAHWMLPRRVHRIGIVHDLQAVLSPDEQKVSQRMVGYMVRFIESSCLRACDRLILLSNTMKQHVSQEYGVEAQRCVVSYPFVTIEEGHGQKSTLGDLFESGYFHVVYSGALGEKQYPAGLMDLFERLTQLRSNVTCHIFSRGPKYDELKAATVAGPGQRIRFHDLVADEDLPELYARSDLQIIPQKEGTASGAFPSKLPNLLFTGVPVFAITDPKSELSNILIETPIGAVSTSWDPAVTLPALCRCIDQVSTRSRSESKELAAPVVDAYFTIKQTIKSLEV